MGHPDDYGPAVLATAFALTSISTVVIFLRLYCNVALIKRAGAADVWMFAAMILTWGIAVTNYYQVQYGSGKHLWEQGTTKAFLHGTLKSWYTFQIIYLGNLLCIKLSILCFYRTISDKRWFRWAIYTMMTVVTAFTISMMFVNAFECPNPSDAFGVEVILVGHGPCRNLYSMYFAQAGFTLGSDVLILLIPIPLVARLQMPRSRRAAIIGIFGVGVIAVIASSLRTWSVVVWAHSTDVPYHGGPILIWSMVEINTAMITASFPALKALFVHTFCRSTTSSRSGSGGARYFKYGYGASAHARVRGSAKDEGAITLTTMSYVKNCVKSSTNPGSGMRSFDNDHESDEENLFLDEAAGESMDGKCSSTEHRDSATGLQVPPKAHWGDHEGIIKSISVEQTTTEPAPGRPQYYRTHFLQ